MNLYFYAGDLDYYFFENREGEIISITKRPDKDDQNDEGKLVRRKDEAYKGIVRYIFQDYKPIVESYDKLKFKHEDMINLTKEYHNQVCTTGEKCIEFETTEDKSYTKFRYSLYAGMQYLFDFSYYMKNEKCSVQSTIPLIGGQIDFSVPRWFKSLSIPLNISFSKLSGEINYPDHFNYSRYSFDAYLLDIKAGGKYTYLNKGRLHPSIEAGIDIAYLLDAKGTNYPSNPYGSKLVYEAPFIEFNYALFGYYVGVGLDYQLRNSHSVFCKISYENLPNGDFDKIEALQIKIGYTF